MQSHGEILKSVAKQKGFTQLSLAEALGVSRSAVQQYMLRSTLGPDIISQLCQVLGVPESTFKTSSDKDFVSKEEYKRLEKVVEYQSSLIKTMESQLQMAQEELEQYKTNTKRQTG